MAEALFRAKMAEHGYEVRSAGVAAFDGQSASLHAIEVMAERGIEHVHQSSRLDPELVDWSDLILTMTTSHKHAVLTYFPSADGKVHTLREFVGVEGFGDIADPFGGTLEDYRRCAEEIEESLDRLSVRLFQERFRESQQE
jgi:protein-tyrosine phosphatase